MARLERALRATADPLHDLIRERGETVRLYGRPWAVALTGAQPSADSRPGSLRIRDPQSHSFEIRSPPIRRAGGVRLVCDPQLISEVPITSGVDAVIARRPGVAVGRMMAANPSPRPRAARAA